MIFDARFSNWNRCYQGKSKIVNRKSRIANHIKKIMNEEVLVKVDNVLKKFFRSLKRSLWYGLQEISSDITRRIFGSRIASCDFRFGIEILCRSKSRITNRKLIMNDEVLVKVDNVSKKFCRSLKRSLFYGLQDIAFEMVGRSKQRFI